LLTIDYKVGMGRTIAPPVSLKCDLGDRIVLQALFNRLADLKPLVPKALATLATVVKGQAPAISVCSSMLTQY